MGWETVAVVGLNLLSSAAKSNAAQQQGDVQAASYAQEGANNAKDVADNTVRAAGKLTTSFLQSGIQLEGGPQEVLSQAFAKGNTDIARTAANADAASQNALNAARQKMLESYASTGSSLISGLTGGLGGLGGSSTKDQFAPTSTDTMAFGLNNAGYGADAYDILSNSDVAAGGF